ncbi:hypothetical protein GS504_00995 [Rhodococcus hoagii]|nr:hypothetical protein [Prescottella equi]NKS72182.1 hypothetical protein [Prescottella equi]
MNSNTLRNTLTALLSWARANPRLAIAAGALAAIAASAVIVLLLPSPQPEQQSTRSTPSATPYTPIPVPGPTGTIAPTTPPKPNADLSTEPWFDTLNGFATAFASPTPTSEQWRAAVNRWTSPAAAAGFNKTDVRTVTADTDPVFELLDGSDSHADVAVRYAGGLAIVVRVRTDPTWPGWKVTEVQPDRR